MADASSFAMDVALIAGLNILVIGFVAGALQITFWGDRSDDD
jgi:hypothetical protein